MGKTIFEKIERAPPTKQENSSAQKLLDWLQHWDEPTVRARDLQIYGPRPRDRESVIRSAEMLVKYGWLVPMKTHRYDALKWQVIRRPIVRPDCGQVSG